ncbi:hypothetical protein [Kitasatospora brasiliensis]|uniref:hypothetical protein n=1 Tax=Kitasatospora brasiliensis TaxID=3058040 RepID=UPI00292E821A|nr:hypothetical protein [Kitasatospora sp. K002]
MTRIGWAVAGWGVGCAGFGLGCALEGAALFGASWAGWAVAGLGAVAAVAGGAVVRRRPVRRLLWLLCGAAAVGAWGLLMDLVTLLFGQRVDSVPDTVARALAAVGAVLSAAAARRLRPGSRGGSGATLAPTAAPPLVQLAAWAGTLAFVPYVLMKLVWALGGSFAGMSGDEMYAGYVRNGSSGLWLLLERWGLDGTVLLALLGVFLLWGLVRPWGQVFPRWTLPLSGRRVPRWLPLTPALLGAATLAPYGVFGVGYLGLCTVGVARIRLGELASEQSALEVGWVGMCGFAGYGVALAVAARSYWRRTEA